MIIIMIVIITKMLIKILMKLLNLITIKLFLKINNKKSFFPKQDIDTDGVRLMNDYLMKTL